jgi:hypothetical protein
VNPVRIFLDEVIEGAFVSHAATRRERRERTLQQLPLEENVFLAWHSSRGISDFLARAPDRHLAYCAKFGGRNIERIDREERKRSVRTRLARRGFIQWQQLDHTMADADREIDHRLHLHDLAAPEIVGSAEGKEGNQDSSRSLQHVKQPNRIPPRGMLREILTKLAC